MPPAEHVTIRRRWCRIASLPELRLPDRDAGRHCVLAKALVALVQLVRVTVVAAQSRTGPHPPLCSKLPAGSV